MIPQPKHLGPIYGAVFKDVGVVEAYQLRPPYPAEVFVILDELIADRPRRVLDVGCGIGHIARRLAPLVDRLDAVDFSSAMIDAAQRLPGGDRPNLRWIRSSVEEAPLDSPYGLITAGESLHWLTWDVVFPRFVDVLAPTGFLAIINREWNRSATLRAGLGPIFGRYSTNRDYRPYGLIAELELRGLFVKEGERLTQPEPWRPSIDEYLECCHSQNGFSRERMGNTSVAFDGEVRVALRVSIQEGAIELRDGRLQLDVAATVVWGKPTWPGTRSGSET